jgi:thymidylate kinase
MRTEIVYLGIDGAGKSTMANMSKAYIEEHGYNVRIVPFHKWVIAGYLRSIFGKSIDKGRKDRKSPYSPPQKSFAAFIKPPVAFIDNIIFHIVNKPRRDKQVVIYDRFVCATQIKFQTLGYQVSWFKKLWWNYKPKNAIIFLLDIDESIERQIRRSDPYAYTKEQLERERNMYVEYARKYKFPIINTTASLPERTFELVKYELDKII